jgi:hypothetical protein
MKVCVVLGSLAAIGLALSPCSKPEQRACQVPREQWRRPHNFNGLMPMLNEVALTHDGSIHWNGDRISPKQFSQYLAASHRLNPEPIVFLQTEWGFPAERLKRSVTRWSRHLNATNPTQAALKGSNRFGVAYQRRQESLFPKVSVHFRVVRGRSGLAHSGVMGWTPPDGIDVPKWRC